MIPILFNKNESAFTSNGLGRLTDAISCKVTEERNGQYELEMEYPLDGVLFDQIANDMIIGAISSVGASLQAFDIYKISKPLSGKVVVNARHISYRLNRVITTGANVSASNSACASALTSLKNNMILAPNQTVPFTLWTDNTTVASFKKSVPMSLRARLGGSEGSILDQFGGEFEWDNFTVKLHHRRGQDTDIYIRYGKNLIDLSQEDSIEDIATGCVGYWRNEEEIVTGTVQLASNHAEFPREKIVSVDFTQQLGTDSKPTVNQVNALAQIYANKHNIPNVNMKVSFVDLAKTEEYKEYAPMEQLHLCDKVYVTFEKLGVSQYAKVIKTVYNVLDDKYDSLEIGDNVSTLFSTITDSLSEEIGEVAFAALNATAWLTKGNGYVVAVKNDDGSWKELLFMDTNDVLTATNVLRINTNGIGFSTNGVGGTYTNAWTIDGHLVADFIDTGTLNASKVNVTNLNASNIVAGTLSCNRISGGTLTLGGSTDGNLVVKNASGTNILSASKTGVAINGNIFTVDTTNFKLTSNGTLTTTNMTANNMTANNITANGLKITSSLSIHAKPEPNYANWIDLDASGLVFNSEGVIFGVNAQTTGMNWSDIWYIDPDGNTHSIISRLDGLESVVDNHEDRISALEGA